MTNAATIVRSYSQPERLWGTTDIMDILKVQRTWLTSHQRRPGSPRPEYEVIDRNGRKTPLWSDRGVEQWRLYLENLKVDPKTGKSTAYSDHNALNRIRFMSVTWKLWWSNVWDGGTKWWFSTPQGWYTSIDDGKTWVPTGEMVRPNDNRYYAVSANLQTADGAVCKVLRSALALREALIAGEKIQA